MENQSLLPINDFKIGYSFTAETLGHKRLSPPLPLEGTINWERINPPKDEAIFSPRHSHATCVFHCPNNFQKDCIWLTGGRTEPYRTFDLQIEDRAADVWWSENGKTWNKVQELTGDFLIGIGNHNAKDGGDVAPWYGRYGHSMDALDTNGDGIKDIMILLGGYEPLESNDVWISTNGSTWLFAGYAPWSARAYHATLVAKGKLWLIGGTPLSNDVWSGEFIPDINQTSGYTIRWVMEIEDGKAPFAPR